MLYFHEKPVQSSRRVGRAVLFGPKRHEWGRKPKLVIEKRNGIRSLQKEVGGKELVTEYGRGSVRVHRRRLEP